MENKRNEESEILRLEANFNNQISALAIVDHKENDESLPVNINSLQSEIQNKIQVDVNELSKVALDLIKQDDKLTDEEVGIELLRNIALNNKSKFMRKLATKMIKEKVVD
ncbi:hypothetical protein AB1K91_18750 [Terribacillus sp. 179-K 1B1 HS]|uniref:hypothetical protein n=1 Tax=Terribacillus sp. 179-K 1B1 HS TaxID=3142388 RepID=UPI00399FEB1B